MTGPYVPPGVEGLLVVADLPNTAWTDRWDRIFVEETIKERLLNHLLFALAVRRADVGVRLALHRLILLAGPPGTGKTMLASGAAHRAAIELGGGRVTFVQVDPHAFPSQLLGETQRSTMRLFDRTIPDLALRGRPVIVLLDEIETLAVSRARASLDTNPVDVHRATQAVLTGIDQVSERHDNVVFLATTNDRRAIDPAFLSPVDSIIEMGLPSSIAAASILHDTLQELGSAAASDDHGVHTVAARCVELALDARRIRKVAVAAACRRRETAIDPARVTIDDLLAEVDSTTSSVTLDPAVTCG